MIRPSLDEIGKLKDENKDKNLVPVFLDMIADLDTPVSAFLKLRQGNQSFLLESVTLGENLSRYSFIGTNPIKTLETGPDHQFKGDPLILLEREMAQYRMISLPELPLPLTGGAIGYCSFDSVRHFEPKVGPFIDKQTDVLNIPESIYMIFDSVVVFDHAFQTLKLVVHCRLDSHDLQDEYERACKRLYQIRDRLEAPLPPQRTSDSPAAEIDWKDSSNVGKEGYMQFVQTLKEHIVEGDIFQAVPSQVSVVEDVESCDCILLLAIERPVASRYCAIRPVSPDASHKPLALHVFP